MSIKIKYNVRSIDSFQCNDWLLHKHYAKRIPAIEYSFGIFKDKILTGVCTFGPPPRVMNDGESIFDTLRIKTLELNRLCINDTIEKNVLSYFVSQCLSMLPKPCCVVSYADHTFGHHGYIYQATNWIYTGLNQIHERQVFYFGKEVHPRTACSMGFTSMVDWAKNDNNVSLGEYTKKHRYLYFIGTSKEKKRMIKELKYKVISYPKGNNNKYDSTYNPTIQTVLF